MGACAQLIQPAFRRRMCESSKRCRLQGYKQQCRHRNGWRILDGFLVVLTGLAEGYTEGCFWQGILKGLLKCLLKCLQGVGEGRNRDMVQ